MLKILLSAVLIGWIGASYGATADLQCCAPVRVDVIQRMKADGQLALAIKLTNIGASAIKFSIGSGPWVGEGQIQLVAIKLPLGVAIPNELRSMRDPALGHVIVEPGKSKEEEVPLAHLYPELAAELSKDDAEYVLFWTYQLHADSIVSKRMGGWLIINGSGKR